MKLLRFAVAMAVMSMALSVPQSSWAQAMCANGDPCEKPGTCTDSGCKNAVYCDYDNDCLDGSFCIRDRCSCTGDSDCGVLGKCFFSVTGTGSCRRPDEPAGCGDKCDSNLDCEVGTCLFGYDDNRGLCCPSVAAEDEQPFDCGIVTQEGTAPPGSFALVLVALGFVAAIRIRSRAAATRRRWDDTRAVLPYARRERNPRRCDRRPSYSNPARKRH